MRPLVLLLAAAALAALSAGCSGSQKWSTDMSWSAESETQARPFREPTALNTLTDFAAETPAWVGVRHDLTVAPTVPRVETCACLHVEVGAPDDAKFAWQNGKPRIEGDLMAIAVTARGLPACRGGEASEELRRASISAVDREGADVYVEIEELPLGRPLATGALFAKPGPNGSVYVRPKNARVPYARPPLAGRFCKVR